MKRILIGLVVLVCGGAVALALMASRYESKIRPDTRVGIVDVGGLAPADAARKLRIWWETEKLREVGLTVPNGKKPPMRTMLAKLGLRLDDLGSVSGLPMEDFWDSTARTLGQGEPANNRFDPKWTLNEGALGAVDEYVRQSIGEPRSARVTYKGGVIKREPEVSGYSVNRGEFLQAITEALKAGTDIQIPIQEAPKQLPDEELDQITDVVSEYSTRFPASQVSRNTNLRLASTRIDGVILMPGDVFSFNDVVGKRTAKDGYRIAGVYRNGRHDVALAGGICQVSGTLYNAVLLANLKIKQRQNHSMPVAYLPVGRDATVDYGSIDFKFENDTEHPIALFSNFESGKLTFGVLGKKDPSTAVKIVTSGHKSWGRGIKYVDDRSLAPGKTKVIEKGSSGHQIDTYRIVLQNGVEVKREYLGRSRYVGGVRIVARGPSAAPKPAADPIVPPPGDAG